MRLIDSLIGKTFDRLQVIEEDKSRPGYVICRCECGNQISIRVYSLTKKRNTRSCGCIQREAMSAVGRRTIHENSARRIDTNMRYGTNFQIIEQDSPPKNNKSGHKGVWYDPTRGRYVAYITLRYKRIHLGYFNGIDDAVKARKDAEEKMFAPLITAKRSTENRSAVALAG